MREGENQVPRGAMRVGPLIKPDRVRRIDRVIDYFGGAGQAGVLPSKEVVAAMGKFNAKMAEAGVLLAAEGLRTGSKGARVTCSGRKRTVTDGPFAETKELLAGCWLIQAKSKEQANASVSRAHGEKVEVHRVSEASDCPPETLPAEGAARAPAWRREQRGKAAKW